MFRSGHRVCYLRPSKTWIRRLLIFLDQCLVLLVFFVLALNLVVSDVVLADEISSSPANVSDIWKCIGCAPEQVGTKMSVEEQEANLNDLWGKEILRQGNFPLEIKDSQEAIKQADPSLTEQIYLVAEGGQIPLSVAQRNERRNPRLSITWKGSGILSTLLSGSPGATTGFLQVIAWDPQKKRFNYYELNEEKNWSWAGDSSHARQPQFIGQGCFDCHHNGSVIMRELKRPWNNWTSELASIDLSVLPEQVTADPNLAHLVGADKLEQDIRGGVSQYYNAWFDDHVSDDLKTVTDVPELLRHLTTTTSVNFESNLTHIGNLGSKMTPPKNFFLFDDVLSNVTGDGFDAGYTFPDTIGFNTDKFQQSIKSKGFALRQCRRREDNNQCVPSSISYEQEGTTFHPFFIPVPSNEDTFSIKNLMRFQVVRSSQRKNIQFLSDKFVASVLMVDFQNPVFSPMRNRLQTYAEKIGTATIDDNGTSNIPDLFASELESVAQGQPDCSEKKLDNCTAEQQFLNTWNLPDTNWKEQVNQRIQSYLNSVAAQINNANGLSDYIDLSISRRQEFASMNPIQNLFEFSLLLPQSDLPVNSPLLRMQIDGTVKAVK